MLALPRVSLVMCGEEAVTESLNSRSRSRSSRRARQTKDGWVGSPTRREEAYLLQYHRYRDVSLAQSAIKRIIQ